MKTNYPGALAVDVTKLIFTGLVLAAGVMLTQTALAAGPAPVDLGSEVTTMGGDTIKGVVGASPIAGSAMYLTTAQVNGTIYAVDNSGPAGSVMDLVIKANGSNNDISINSGANLSITVQINLGEHPRAYVDWWVIARANSGWYYLNSSMQWLSFDRNLSNCHPVYQGALFDLPETQALNITGLPAGEYRFWFAVDQMDWIWIDSVNVTVQ
jgi:hypothetical protein